MSRRRVVVTGMGLISPIGNTIAGAWENLLAGKSGIRQMTGFDTSKFGTTFAGLINDFDSSKYMSDKDARRFDLFIQYGIAAGVQAIADAGLENSDIDKDRVGLMIGSGIGGLGTIIHSHDLYLEGGPRKISPFFIPGCIINMIAGNLSIMYGYRGPNLAVATACTTSTHSIGLAARTIAYGDADIVIAGGAEKASNELGVGGFGSAKALSRRNDDPEKASRPWDRGRDGFVMGDGAGILVMEELNSALARGANIYCELTGFGMSADAFHITRPSGEGAVLAMQRALADAGCNPEEVHYINAHATSTPAGDMEELSAIKKVFGDCMDNISISSSKSMTGHLLGAAGAVEAIVTALAIKHQIAPPTINLDDPEPGTEGIDLVPWKPKPRKIESAMSNSFGFGGTNGTLLFKRYIA